MAKLIKFTITKGGKVTAEAQGYQGGACQDATAKYMGLGRREGETLKPEFYEQPREEGLALGGGA